MGGVLWQPEPGLIAEHVCDTAVEPAPGDPPRRSSGLKLNRAVTLRPGHVGASVPR